MHQQLALVLAMVAVALPISFANKNGAAAGVSRMKVIHVDAGRGLSNRELFQRMALRSKARAALFLSKEAASAPVTPGKITGGVLDTEYLAHFGIGTPPQPVQVTFDTGSDLVWTQCLPCKSCFHQALPFFDPSLSSTFTGVPCRSTACQSLPQMYSRSPKGQQQVCAYAYGYGDGSMTIGRLEADTVTFADGPHAAVSFGCGHNNRGVFTSNETGIVGFGRGFFLVLLGLPANLYNSARGAVQTTRIVKDPNFYYLSLRGITVGSTRLPVPESAFARRDDGSGGTIIDSGTGITALPTDVYKLLRKAFLDKVRLPVYDAPSLSPLCFVAPSAEKKPGVPKLLFHFDEGATLDLPRENYMFEAVEAGRSITCLAINDGGDMTIIGNYQQQNMHVLYDLAGDKLSFVPAQCEKI
ncbi:unnamed protein product [Urochloa humidicola]